MSPQAQIQASPQQPHSSRFHDSPLGSCYVLTSISTKYLDVVPTASQWDGKNKLLLHPIPQEEKKIHLHD